MWSGVTVIPERDEFADLDPNEKPDQITTKVSSKLKAKLEEIAQKTSRSQNETVRLLLANAIRAWDRERAKAK
jgi:predicted transcriptional regulator